MSKKTMPIDAQPHTEYDGFIETQLNDNNAVIPTRKGYARAVRSQADNLGDIYSHNGALHTGEESDVRPELAHDADINTILTKFGIHNEPVLHTHFDDSIDLQQAMNALKLAQAANLNVPPELAHKYPTWREVLNAAETGEYATDLANLETRKKNAAAKQAEREADEKAFQAWKAKTEPKEVPKTD